MVCLGHTYQKLGDPAAKNAKSHEEKKGRYSKEFSLWPLRALWQEILW